MFGYFEKKKFRRYFYSSLTLGVFSLVLAGLSLSAWDRYETERDTYVKREELIAERDRLAARAGELSDEIAALQTPRGVEAKLREKFEVGAPGEKLIVVVDPEVSEPPPAPPPRKSFLEWLRSWFTEE
jgi:cell division protein FtsB